MDTSDGGQQPRGDLPVPGTDAAGVPSHRLSGREVSRVLRLAARADQLADIAHEALTVQELMEAAREAGIDPGMVARAAAVSEDPTSTLATAAFGAPDTRVLRAHMPDRHIPEDRKEMLRALELTLGRRGQLHEGEPGHLLWKEDHTLGRTTLSVVETEEGTEVVLEADRAGHYLGSWFVGVLVWGLLAALTPLGAMGPVAAVAGFLVAPFLLARPFWIRSDRKRRRRLEAAMMGVLGRIDATAALPPGAESEG